MAKHIKTPAEFQKERDIITKKQAITDKQTQIKNTTDDVVILRLRTELKQLQADLGKFNYELRMIKGHP